MITLPRTISSLQDPDFKSVACKEIAALGLGKLPLQQAVQHSSYALDSSIKPLILSIHRDGDTIHLKAGVYFTGMIAGCNCSDDPSPVDEVQEYCELLLTIKTDSGQTEISLLDS